MHKIYKGAGLILRQYSPAQSSPIKISELVKIKYLKRWIRSTCILVFYFSTESKQMGFFRTKAEVQQIF